MSCLGPLAGLVKQREQYKSAVAALADPARTRLVLVARAQASALREVARTHEELGAVGLARQYLVVNGVLPEGEARYDRLAAAITRREHAALADMPGAIATLPRDHVALKPFNLMGVDALRQLLDGALVTAASAPPRATGVDAPGLDALVEDIAADGHGLVMLMGKGGVGKTSLAAAIAIELAGRGLPVHLTTTDPAAHLTETLDGALPGLTVSRIDPQAETERYRAHVMATRGAGLDADGRALLEEDLRSPCTEEVAVFQAFSRIVREAGRKFVVMDTAPTGHTLLLLDATGAYHREVTRQMGAGTNQVTTPMMQLQDPRQTKVLIVTLAEPTPVLEAASLQADLRRAGIEPWAWIVNQSVAASATSSPLLTVRAGNELREIAAVAASHARRYAVVRLLEEEPVGVARLRALAGVAPAEAATA
jgi:arsenite-transporting ATPase